MSVKTPLVSAILLAAGKSERMGRNKLLMPFEGGTVIARTLDNLATSKAGEVMVVLGSHAREIGDALGKRPVTFVLNPDYARGMSTSLITGLRMISKRAKFALVALGDQPFVAPKTYDRLIEVALCTDKGLVVPVYQKQRGNPILIHAGYFPEMMGFTGDVGGRELFKLYPDDVLEVKVQDEGVLINLNTTKEYERHIGPAPRSG